MVGVPAATVHRSKLRRFSKICRQCLGDGAITRVRLRACVPFGGGKSVVSNLEYTIFTPLPCSTVCEAWRESRPTRDIT